MKRRNADTGKMRRPVKRTKITEGMYGNSMLYLKFVMLWATVVMADYMLEFRFEFLWPFWMILRSVYDSFKYQGLAFSVFFICIALTSDMICFFFIPLQYIFFAASTYVWVQYVWYSFADKGICLPTVAICCVLVYVEGALRTDRGGGVAGGGLELCRPLAAHCVGYPVVTLGFGVKSYVGHRLRLRRQKQVRAENEFYFQLMKDALPESALEQNQQTKESERTQSSTANGECPQPQSQPATEKHAHAHDTRHMNGSLRRKVGKTESNGSCVPDPAVLQAKLDKLERHLQEKAARTAAHAQSATHAHSNGTAPGAHDADDKHEHSKGGSKSKCEKKEASTLKEEKRKNKNKDKDKDNHSDSHKNTEQTKEQIVKDVESTKENHIRNHKECSSSYKEREKEKEREREREKEKEMREREKERERERERESREARECAEELRRVKSELMTARTAEAEAKRALAAAAAADRQRRQDYHQLKQAHQALQHKLQTWRSSERAALERRLGEERRARTAAETQLRSARHAHSQQQQQQQQQQLQQQQLQQQKLQQQQNASGECENSWCASRRAAQAAAEAQVAAEADAAAMRRDLRRARERAEQLQRDLTRATEQVRSLEEEGAAPSSRLAGACAALQERAAHLERSLSAETRVKLDLLSALGEAKRQMHIQEGLISRQEKEIEELKAQMLAVMPTEFVTPVSGTVSKLRLESSPLDPNASVYTPKQLCSDA
ncbi:macoilin-2 [Hyposmocoma kahamanoa]|uniref:macoilin-2 n=1 Tax=Hyposmocoma kahamanoa TaxID=1477025 RepID=UPI000E6D8E71|nr:macoilin-2 [Hyposmocoma kahamanoa]